MHELIGRRKRAGFVGRRSELDLFRGNFDTAPEDERHTFVFHVHGTAGVGKSSLVRELEAVATQRKALTARTDETVNSVPEAMAAISAQFARQGAELKALDKLLASYHQRRHEAETASAALESAPEPGSPAPPPSAGSMAVTQAGLIGFGMVPVVGAFAGAIDPAQVAHGTDRLRAALSARFRNHDDVQLVLEPLKVLTPVFISELDRVAADAPWIALFFDTYERTAPFLDGWLFDLVTTERYGALPANVVLTLAGQHGPDPTRWGDYAGFVTELALEPFTESEARQLLAAKGVLDQNVVREVLRLSGGLPVLVSTLAKDAGGGDAGAVDDPSPTAVERFLKRVRDPALRAAVLACALPRRLSEDAFRTVVDGEVEEAYAWLLGLPFVSEQAGRVRYHDVVRTAMLRLQRTRSPRQWAERHTRLAEAYAGWRAAAEEGLDPDELWLNDTWRELRLEELYHHLCARPQGALAMVLGEVVDACRADVVAARGCAQVLGEAGEQAEVGEVARWGSDLLAALAGEAGGVLAALGLMLGRAGLDTSGRAKAHSVRARELRNAGDRGGALVEYGRAIALDPQSPWPYDGRALIHEWSGDSTAALIDLDRTLELRPPSALILTRRGDVLRTLGRHEEAIADFDRALALDPVRVATLAMRGLSRYALGQGAAALADLDHALEIDGEYLWGLVQRAKIYRDQGRLEESFAELDRAAEIAPDRAWIASVRGDAYRTTGRYEEAAEELARACALDPDYASAYASRGYALARLGRDEEARAAFDRAIELHPTYAWALVHRALLRGSLGDLEGKLADLERAVAAGEPGLDWVRRQKTAVLVSLSGDDEAVAELDRVLERDPDNPAMPADRGVVRLRRGLFLEALRDLDRAISLRPDETGPYAIRARACIAMGRLPQALADLGYCVAREEELDWAIRRTAEVLFWCGRHDEARRLLVDRGALTEQEGDAEQVVSRWYVDTVTGRWERARHVGEWTHPDDFVHVQLRSALKLGMSTGLEAAEPLWQLVRTSARADGEIDAAHKLAEALASCALGDWSGADSAVSEGLSLNHDWADLADLAARLTLLARTPDADPALFGPCLTRATTARDAFQARYAE
ncbi:ATP-binding protein [Streptomyces tailanensis]|uniref:ATP-binding protein n=1 Tax=Streptomyces tailanensis TaxID=2569858 RepID=UPI001FEC5172|nr:ATP-binding protein [Streptomyces tailanensis]